MKTLFQLWVAMWLQMIAPGAFTHSVGITYKSQEGTITNTTDSFTGDGEAGVDTTVGPSITDQAEECQAKVAAIVSLCLFSTLALTLKTYAAGVLKDTIALPAGKQIVWNTSHLEACPFTVDFDTVKLTNADLTKTATVKIRILKTT